MSPGGEPQALVADPEGDWQVLLAVAPGGSDPGAKVQIVCTECAYTCCARGPYHRAGYEQTYAGQILSVADTYFQLAAPGIGAWTYQVTVPRQALLAVERV